MFTNLVDLKNFFSIFKSHHLECKIEVRKHLYEKHINCTGDCSHFFVLVFTTFKHVYHIEENVGEGGEGYGASKFPILRHPTSI